MRCLRRASPQTISALPLLAFPDMDEIFKIQLQVRTVLPQSNPNYDTTNSTVYCRSTYMENCIHASKSQYISITYQTKCLNHFKPVQYVWMPCYVDSTFVSTSALKSLAWLFRPGKNSRSLQRQSKSLLSERRTLAIPSLMGITGKKHPPHTFEYKYHMM